MMIAACRNKRGLESIALGQLEAEHTAVELKCPFQVRDLEVHMTDADIRVNCTCVWHYLIHLSCDR